MAVFVLATNGLFPFSSVFSLASWLKADNMVVAASQNPPGVEAPPQSVPFGMQGSRHAGPNPYRGPSPNHLDRQQQGNWPFFYVQPSQPYLPCQWPMPMPYVPYGGFPGLGRWSCLNFVCTILRFSFVSFITELLYWKILKDLASSFSFFS